MTVFIILKVLTSTLLLEFTPLSLKLDEFLVKDTASSFLLNVLITVVQVPLSKTVLQGHLNLCKKLCLDRPTLTPRCGQTDKKWPPQT